MGWVGNKWFPAWRGDYCQGFYHPPEDGSEPIWELKIPEYEGLIYAGDNLRPRWVMVNGREMPSRLVYAKSGTADCNIMSGEPPRSNNGWGFPSAKHYCSSHGIWLMDDDDVLDHFNGNRGVYGQWLKSQGKKLEKKEEKKPAPEIEVPENIAIELRTALEPILNANAKFVALWKQGKTGPLIGAAMRVLASKYEGRFIEQILREKISAFESDVGKDS
jgi:hypothetical protein